MFNSLEVSDVTCMHAIIIVRKTIPSAILLSSTIFLDQLG